MKVESAAPKTKKKADARQRIGRMVLVAEDDEEEITLAWLRSLLSVGYLQNLRSTAHSMTVHADTDLGGMIRPRRLSETYRLVDKKDEDQ